MDWNLLFSSYANVFLDPQVLLMTLLGAAGGVLLGAIPGMTATMGVALLIPFSFGMDLIPSIGLLLGIFNLIVKKIDKKRAMKEAQAAAVSSE